MNQRPPWFAQQQPQYSHKMPLPRTTARIVFKITLYFVGAIIAEFGLLAVAVSVPGSNKNLAAGIVGGTLFIGLGAAAISISMFFLKRYHIHCLAGVQYLWWVLGTTIASLMAFVLVFAIANPNTNRVASVIASSILLLYGISLMWIAYMKPSLAQQINESVYRILKATPGEQIATLDLLARLQKEYKHLGTTVNQHLGNLDYMEQENVPGTPVMICRMKPLQQAAPVPQMIPAPVTASQSRTAPMTQPTQEPVKQTIAPPSVHINPANSLRPKEAFASFEVQSTAPAIPTRKPNQVPALPPVQSAVPIPPSSQTVTPTTLEANKPNLLSSVSNEQQVIKIFCCYAHQDEQLLNKLKAHLKPQQRQGLIQIWHDRDISAGAEWESEIEEQLNTAQIVLLLVSPDFMASDYCYTKEMQRALERHARGEVRAIPIILRPTDWLVTPLGKLQALPKDGKPITTWSNRDNAYLDVARGIRAVVETFLTPPQRPKKQVSALNDYQKAEAEVELVRARCKQGKLIVTNKSIVIQLSSFGHVLKSQSLFRASLTSIDSKLAAAPLFGMGGGYNLTFHGKGREVLHADLVPSKEAKEIIALLS